MTPTLITNLVHYMLALVIVLTLPLKLAFTIFALVNGGMSDWLLLSQILKLHIADIAVDYNIVFINFELSAPLMLPVEA